MIKKFSFEAMVIIALLTATGLNWLLVETGLNVGGDVVRFASAAILVIAFAKVWLVIEAFMEVREAPSALRATMTAWTVLVCGALVVQILFFA